MPEEATELHVETPEPETAEMDVEPAAEDPGQNEGLPKKTAQEEEHDTHSKRFKEVYWRMKENERKYSEMLDTQKAMQEHNRALMDKLESVTSKAIDTVGEVARSQSAAKDKGPQLEEKLEQLEQEKLKAMDPLNFNAELVTKLDREIRQIDRQIWERDTSAKAKQKPDQVAQPPDLDPDSKWFVEQSPWFNSNAIMRGAAIALDNELAMSPEWSNKSNRDRLAEVKRQVESQFNYASGDAKEKPTKPKPASAVEPADSALGGNKVNVRLTSEELKVASGFGMTPEEYARQKAFMER